MTYDRLTPPAVRHPDGGGFIIVEDEKQAVYAFVFHKSLKIMRTICKIHIDKSMQV